MTREELQQMLDSFQKEVTKKDWEIDRDIRLKGMSKIANEISRKVVSPAKTMAQKTNGKKNKGRILSEETKIKISESTKGKSKSEIHRKKISEAHKGKSVSEGTKKKISESRMGIKCEHTSKRNSEMNSKRFKCEHCGREIGGLANYKRFHADNCKKK